MKRNIVTTLEFKKGKIVINVLEKLANNNITIFSDNDSIKNINIFIKESFEKINSLVNGKVKDIFVIVEPYSNDDTNIKLVKNQIQVVGNNISKKDINYLISSTKEKFKEPGKEIILAHPLQFSIEGVVRKNYSQAPINIKGDYLSATMALSYISQNTHVYIENITQAHGLSIIQIFTNTQTIPNICLSKSAMHNGSLLINFSDRHIFVSINKNGGTIDHFNLFESGYNKLIKAVQENFNCTNSEANNLILVYGTLYPPKREEIIFTRQEGIKEIMYTNIELYKIMENYLTMMISIIKKYIFQKNIKNLPLVISGEISKIDGLLDFFKQNINSSNVTIYNPVQFLETNLNNQNILGVIELTKTLHEVLGENLITIVQTNPNSFEYLKNNSKKPKNIFNRIIDKLGGLYDWNI